MSERERFDAWADSKGVVKDHVFREVLWEAWQAARSGQAASGSQENARSDDQNGVGVGQPEAPTAAPEFTIDDPDLNDFANAVHLLVTPGCGGHDAGMAYLMALDRLQARLYAHPPARSGADPTTAAPLERGTPCEVQDGDPDSPTHRQWFPARLVALDLIGGEPIVQRDKRMPTFATWGSVRGIKKPTRDLAYVAGAAYERDAAGHWSAHPPARSGAGSDDARDAARYRWLRAQSYPWGKAWFSLVALDVQIDAAIAFSRGVSYEQVVSIRRGETYKEKT